MGGEPADQEVPSSPAARGAAGEPAQPQPPPAGAAPDAAMRIALAAWLAALQAVVLCELFRLAPQALAVAAAALLASVAAAAWAWRGRRADVTPLSRAGTWALGGLLAIEFTVLIIPFLMAGVARATPVAGAASGAMALIASGVGVAWAAQCRRSLRLFVVSAACVCAVAAGAAGVRCYVGFAALDERADEPAASAGEAAPWRRGGRPRRFRPQRGVRLPPLRPRRRPTTTPTRPTTQTRPAHPGAYRLHTVQRGQTLESIARLYYGSAEYAPLIVDANPEVDLERLRPGQRIQIPPRPDGTAPR